MKTIKLDATLNAATKVVTLNIQRFNIKNLYAIINQTKSTLIYATGVTGLGHTASTNNTITLEYDTTSMSNTDALQVIYEDGVTENSAQTVGNGVVKFRDGFESGVDNSIWTETWINKRTSQRLMGGNSSGSGYLAISLSPYSPNSIYTLTSTQMFKLPVRFGYGLSMSQRVLGVETEVSLVGCDIGGNIEYNTTIADLPISGTVSVTSNVATITFASNHNLRGGDRVVLINNTDSRLNVGPVSVTIVNPLQVTVPLTIANGTYTAGGSVSVAEVFDYAKNALGLIQENTTATNATFATRRNGSSIFSSNQTITTTIATQSNTSPYTEAFRSASDNELVLTMEAGKYYSRTASSLSGAGGGLKYTESLPDEDKLYKIRLRVKQLGNYSSIVGTIASIAKTGTTTATVTTTAPHGLTTSDFVNIYGVRDITNFPNLTAQTQVASVISSTQFTIVIGSASTTSSAGGVVVKCNGNVTLPGALNFSIQSIAASGNVLNVTLNTTASGLLVGETVELAGMDGAGLPYNMGYIVRRLSASVVELQTIDSSTITDIASTNCGGAIIKRTDVRLHYVRGFEYTRHAVEISNNRGISDASEVISTAVSNQPNVNAVQSGNWTVLPGNTANTTPWLVQLRGGTANGNTTTTINSAAGTNATLIKNTTGLLFSVTANNTTAAAKYLRLYNLTTAPTVGTSPPALVYTIPASSSIHFSYPIGLTFGTGMSLAITNGAAYLDATAVAANDVQLTINWQ
jgi:hypothetical protein